MSSFPEWARPWLTSGSTQVSHGLNLVLEMDPAPNRLPLLLWDIMLAQDKIKRALEELSFVHFARFVPSWDGRALMVTTEFDGPLDPYVLDFVIALGDVFDTLLGYVKEKPKTPVREHPDEFLAWVRKWNRVPFYLRSEATLFPEDFDFPVYSAYPDKTVTDISGARTEVPMAALDHPGAAVDPTDVQGNILRGFNASQVSYLFFTITDQVVARNWLALELVKPGTPWLGVTDAVPWPGGKAPAVLTQVALSFEGLQKLLASGRQDELKAFPVAFREGAAKRANDNFDRDLSKPEHWLFGQLTGEQEHVVLLLYTKETGAAAAPYAAAVHLLEHGAAKGLKHLRTIVGASLGGYEPFGFRDNLSEPRISGQCPGSAPEFQPSASPGEFLLHRDYTSIYGGRSLGNMPQQLAGNGSFGVLRLMEQDVARFKTATEQEAARLGVDKDRLRANLVGRRIDGTPLAVVPVNPTGPLNAFDYAPSWEFPDLYTDHDGVRCPVGAHIRRANPRTARVAGQRHGRRLLRRGMPTTWDEGGVGKVGLMGLFLGASIEQQFEFIQRQWLQDGLAASGIHGTTDPIAAVRSANTEFRFFEPDPANPHGPPRAMVAMIPPLITTRGCLYLFFPGIGALKTLDATVSLSAMEAATAIDAGAKVEAITGTETQRAYFPDLPRFTDDVNSSQVTDRLLLDWIEQPALQDLLDGRWQRFIEALIQRDLDSALIKDLIDSFAPPDSAVKPSTAVDQGGIDLSKTRFRANPFEALRLLREAKKTIVWVKEQQAYWVLDHAGCRDLLARNGDFVQTQSAMPFRGVVTLDLPHHKVVRDALDQAFRAALAATGPKIDRIVKDASKDLLEETNLLQFDYMQSFAHPVARAVIWDLIGIGDADQRKACDALAYTMTLAYGKTGSPHAIEPMVLADAGLRMAARLALPLADAWRYSFPPLSAHSPYKNTLIGELAQRIAPGVPLPGRPLQFIETLLTLLQTVLASQSPHLLLTSAALHLLSPDPRPEKGGATPWSELAALSNDTRALEEALDLALNETRRCEPPLALIERYAHGEQKICGVIVPDRCAVFAMVASGNRDDAVFGPGAEEFHWDRAKAAGHLSLGYGLHECAGQFVQRKLLPAALTLLIKSMPNLRLSNPTAVPAWYPTIYFRLLQALPVARCLP